MANHYYIYESSYDIQNSFFDGNIHSYYEKQKNLENNTFTGKENVFNDTFVPTYYEGIATLDEQLEIGTYTVTIINPIGQNKINITLSITKSQLDEYLLKLDIITFTTGANNITASIYQKDTIQVNITHGKIAFKINGKILKDDNGKVIYVKVVNGTATIENYEIPESWIKPDTTIQAIYTGSTQCDKLTSQKTNITVSKSTPTLTTEDITASKQDKITLKATITDNDKVINTGKIVFKINGKTVKDAYGKVIYAKVVNNTVILEYRLLESMKAGIYNITATFISSNYDCLTASKSLTVN